MREIFEEIGKKRKITANLIKHLIKERIHVDVSINTIQYIAKRYLDKSWQKVTSKRFIPEHEIAQRKREGY